MKRIIFFHLFILVFSCMALAQTGQWTLQQCVDTALARNLQIRQRGLQAQTAVVNVQQARANRLPGVSAGVEHGIQQGRSIDPFTNAYVNQQINYASYGVGGEVTLYNGLSLKNNIRQNAYAADAARMDQQQEQNIVTLNVILAYLQVLNNEDLVRLSRTQVSVTQQQVDRLEILNQQGAISPPLLYDLRGQLKGEEVTLVNAVNAVQTAKLALLQLMNLPYDSTMKVARTGIDTTLTRYALTSDAVYQNAVEQLALVKAATLRTQSAQAAVKAARGQLYPSFSLSGNLASNYSSIAQRDNLIGSSEVATDAYVLINGGKTPVLTQQNNYASQKIDYLDQVKNNIFTNVGLVMRVPILNALQTRNRIKLAQINVKNAALVEDNTKLQLRQAIDQAYLNLTNSWERYNVLTEQVAAYAESFRAAEVRFNAGASTSVDYILAKSRLDAASLNLVVAQYDYVLRTKVLDFYNSMP
jgi:outer membrane protein